MSLLKPIPVELHIDACPVRIWYKVLNHFVKYAKLRTIKWPIVNIMGSVRV